ncbi:MULTISPECIES: DUF1848 domain-containing protein [unclassified Pseudomonas]|uniref:DUF1848 domain-containing protein n=1 Tax=unclassified Pseudomonas TaxID=196821 RepID=UPI000CD0505F|nr:MULTISPECIES: DUF1848 domain-containing protein [unclassified Pseudomonas]POA23613.1 hypothetical protein C1895_19090 [Pseudomonas sp. FW305-3-2-15-E-TSA4]POA37259.1 hypothetical protein C1894_23095 [Pseudomonas sp. FW305-3-2-15-E-TSA2]
MIISASRRTDIPAFYHDWFMNRVRQGFLLSRNPFNYNQISRVSLLPADVDAIVFWTRNPKALIQSLDVLDKLGLKYYFQYTITGYPRSLERSVPKPLDAIRMFIQLSELIGKEKVIWRYDPILLSNFVDLNEHKRLFGKIAGLLAGRTDRVVISFSDFYKKTERNLNAVDGLIYSDIVDESSKLLDLSRYMATVANSYGMQIQSCAEVVDTTEADVPHGRCIDNELLRDVFGLTLSDKKDQGQRDACGCVKSVDIGAYNTCLHECSYCYATFNKEMVLKNRRSHDPQSPFLIGGAEGVDPTLLTPGSIQSTLF